MPNTNLHPAVTALETAMAKVSAAQMQIAQGSQWMDRSVDNIDPVRWTQKIEEALGKPDEMKRLRVIYAEKTLSFITACLKNERAYRQLFAAETLVCEGIRDVIEAHDAIDNRSADAWLKPVMQNRCIEAANLHRQSRQVNRQEIVYLDRRASNILIEAFTTLSNTIVPGGPRLSYTTDLVVPGCKYETFLNPDVDLRNVDMVDFVGCVESPPPANKFLFELMQQLKDKLESARLAKSRVKGGEDLYISSPAKINNVTINERQHADSLLDALQAETYGCNGKTADQMTAQNERRRLYEAVRQELLIAYRALHHLHRQLAQALHAAVVETQGLLPEGAAAKHTRVDHLCEQHRRSTDTMRICMNNCLAVDLRLRQVGRELESMQSLYNNDVSLGAGRHALAAHYNEVRVQYGRQFPKSTD